MDDAKLEQLKTVVNTLDTSGFDVREIVRDVFYGYLYSIETVNDGVTPKNWQDVLWVWEEIDRFVDLIEPLNPDNSLAAR